MMDACLDLELQKLDVVDDLVQHRRLVRLKTTRLSNNSESSMGMQQIRKKSVVKTLGTGAGAP
jgi:hypothetical protein